MMSYPSACRDEEVFEDSFRFRVDRKPNPHLTFAHGPHNCLGQVLARQELTIFYTQLLKRVDHIELNGDPSYLQSLTFVGLKSLPIRYRMVEEQAGPAS